MQAPSSESLSYLIKNFQNDDFLNTEKIANNIVTEFPHHDIAWRILGKLYTDQNRATDALYAILKAVELIPEDAGLLNNLGLIQQDLGELRDSVVSFKKSVEINPSYPEAKFNLANTFHKLGRKEEAKSYYLKALEINPGHFAANINLGVTFLEMNKYKDSEKFFRKSNNLKPDISLTHNYLGYTHFELNKLNDAFYSFLNAIEITPDYQEAWNNIYYPIKLIKPYDTKSLKSYFNFINKQEYTNLNLKLAILEYKLNIGKKEAKQFYDKALTSLLVKKKNIIKNPKPIENSVKIKPNKVIGLLHFGRSGSGLLHSLIDNHSEVMTLPSIYFSEFFDPDNWDELIKLGWEKIIDRFIEFYPVFFDARSPYPIKSINKSKIEKIGILEGMTSLGANKNEYLFLDKNLFKNELFNLISKYKHLDHLTFFYLVHYAYEKLINKKNNKKIILYHIHNPDVITKLNFARQEPDAKWIVIVRNPVDSLESWIYKAFYENRYYEVVNSIRAMLLQVDDIFFFNKDVIGLKLEDLKSKPENTITLLCKWMGIKKEKSLFEMTAQGKKWWGDRSNPHMPAFGSVSKSKIGKIFSENDALVFNTLFYPFSVKFGYKKEDLNKFKNDLQLIKPLIDKIFNFEEKLADRIGMSHKDFMNLGSYRYLRKIINERYTILEGNGTYSNLISPISKIV